MSAFKRAVRQRTPMKIALTGPASSGKTYGALQIAMAFSPGGRIAVIDSENESSNLYAHLGEYDVAAVHAPYTVPKYLGLLEQAIAEKFEWVIVDSLSHAWAGEGGLLEKKDGIDNEKRGNQYTSWAPITKEHEKFKAKLVESPVHLIATMRSKQDYILVTNSQGKQEPQKIGMAPVQRDGMDYEFSVVLEFNIDHSFRVTKDRSGLYPDPTATYPKEEVAELGRKLAAWHAEGDEWTPPPPPPEKWLASPDFIARYERLAKRAEQLGIEPEPLTPKHTNDRIADLGRALTAKIAEAEKAGVQ